MGQVFPTALSWSRETILKRLGTNTNSNDWNRTISPAVCVHGFVGRMADGTVASVQTLALGHSLLGLRQRPQGQLQRKPHPV